MDMIFDEAKREKIAQELAGGLILPSNALKRIEMLRIGAISDGSQELLLGHGTCFGCIG